MMARLSDTAGLTLIELVVALTVTGLALSVGYGAFASLMDHRGRVLEGYREVSRAVAVRQAIGEWLKGARLTMEPGLRAFRGHDGVWEGLADDELVFLTTAPTQLGDGEASVRIYVDREEATEEKGLVVELREWRGSRSRRMEIDSSVVGLNVRYLSHVTDRRWLSSWVSSTVLPAAVELRFSAGDGTDLHPLLSLPILADVALGR